MWLPFHVSDTYKVSSDSDIMLNLNRPLLVEHLGDEDLQLLFGITFPGPRRGKGVKPFVVSECVGCLVFRLDCSSFPGRSC